MSQKLNILVLGARGFIGETICNAAQTAGHNVIRGVRTKQHDTDITVDYLRDNDAKTWLPRLQNIDAVVNAVGLLGGTEADMMRVHGETPDAIAAACAQAGITRFVQVSALGVGGDLTTRYFRSKLAGEQAVRAALPSAHIVRPSLVFGKNGDSTKMFMQLTRLPALMLPQSGGMMVQPVHVNDVAQAVVNLIGFDTAQNAAQNASPKTMTLAGTNALSMRDYLASLATQLGRRAPYVLPMPMFAAKLSANLMQYLPQHVWTPETLMMLVAGSTANEAELAQFTAVLGRSILPLENFVAAGADHAN